MQRYRPKKAINCKLFFRHTYLSARRLSALQNRLDVLSDVGFKRLRADERLVVCGRQKFRWFPVGRREEFQSSITLGRTVRMIDALRPDLTSEHNVILVRLSNLHEQTNIHYMKHIHRLVNYYKN